MVGGTPEEWLAKKKVADVPVGNLSDFDKQIVGGPARIEIPFSDLSGRALWFWRHKGYAPLGFLHKFYYDTLHAVSTS